MIKLKHVVGFIGVIIAICGFAIDNADYFKFIYSIIAPSYTNAMIAYDKMYVRGFVLREGDVGFKEISQMVKDTAFDDLRKEIPELKITQIKTINWGFHDVFDPAPPVRVDFIALETLFENHPQPEPGMFRDFKGKIKEKYFTNTLYQWKTIIFGIGILIIVMGLFL